MPLSANTGTRRSINMHKESPFVFLLILTIVIQKSSAYNPFGTKNGYDVEGGTDPICWESSISNGISTGTSGEITKNQYFDYFNFLDDALVDSNYQNTIRRYECYNGTEFSITPRNANRKANRFQTGSSYIFDINLKLIPSEIARMANLNTQANLTRAFFRLMLCDSTGVGFCTPMYHTPDTLNGLYKDVIKNLTTNTNVPDQFSYDENTTLVGNRQKLHIVSRFIGRTLHANKAHDGIHKAAIGCTFEVPLGMEGIYFVIAHSILHFITDDGILRVDMAAAIPDNVLQYSSPPEVKTVTKGFKIGFGSILSFFLALEIGIFAYIIHKRSHPVLKISQANFLAMLVACTILVTVSCIFLLPTKDINCTLQGPLILIPLTTMASILVGRLWRAYSMLSVVLSMGRRETPRRASSARIMNFLASMADWRIPKCFQRWCFRKAQRRRSTKAGLRTAVLESDLYRLVFLLTLPQLLLQVLAIIFLPGEIEIELNEDESIGRTVCKRDLRAARWVGDLYLMLLLILSVIVAWICRDLPSLFNEKDAIFNAAGITTFITFLTVSLLIITDEPSTSPNATVLLWTFMTLGVSTTISWLIIAPKIRLVWSGYNFDFSTIFSPTGQKPHTSSDNSTNLNDTESKGPDGQVIAPTIECPTQNVKSRIWLKDRDTPPQAILAQLLSAKGAIEQVTESSLQGHLVSKQEWTIVQVETRELQLQLDQIDFVDESQHEG